MLVTRRNQDFMPTLFNELMNWNDTNYSTPRMNIMETKDNYEEMRYLRHEFSVEHFRQTVMLPEDIHKEQISAKVENGRSKSAQRSKTASWTSSSRR